MEWNREHVVEGVTFLGGTLDNQGHGSWRHGARRKTSGSIRKANMGGLVILSLLFAGCASEPEQGPVVETELVMAEEGVSSSTTSENE